MKKYIIRALVAVCLLSLTTINGSAASWEHLVTKQGFSIYKREVANSEFVEFKGFGTIKAPMIDIMAVLDDVPTHCKWITNCIQATEVQKNSDFERLVYYATDSPWPVKDRDMLIRVKVSVDEKNKWVHLSSRNTVHPRFPVNDKYIRIPSVKIKWSFHPANNGKSTIIEFKSHANPGGSLPTWMVNFYGKYMALDTLLNLEKRVLSTAANEKFRQKFEKYSQWK